ncbi:MAG: bifunctional oligoribonuclease/PAP phosphatase NrnA, partial [Bullifex sp.]
MTKEDFIRAAEIIGTYDTVIIHRHTHPDGDAIGSQTGLKHILKKAFPGMKVYSVGDDPGRYGFITDSMPDTVSDSEYENALAIVLDTSSPDLISDERYKCAKEKMRFDHHIFSCRICDHEFTDSSYESCCGIIADFARYNGFEPDSVAAEALYTGLVTDSGRFLYDSVSSRTHETAAWLLEHEFDRSRIYSYLYSEDFASVLRKAEFVKKIRFTENRVAWV